MTDRPALKEIEITPEMIKAGVDVYCTPWIKDDDADDIVIEIYRAMALASLDPLKT